MFETTSTQQNPGPTIFPTAGVYAVTLTVTDAYGQSDPAPPVVTIRVLPPPPKGQILSPPDPGEVQIMQGSQVVFDGNGSSDGGEPITYVWSVEKL